MEKKRIAFSPGSKNGLDDDYTLYEDGSVMHLYDVHHYPGGYNLKEYFVGKELSQSIRERIINDTSEENKEIAKNLLEL